MIPVLIGVVVDRAIGRSDVRELVLWLAVLGALFIALILSWRYGARSLTAVSTRGEHDLRLRAVRRVMHPHGMRTSRATGETLTITSSDTAAVAAFSWSVAEIAAAGAALITALVSLVVISWSLAVGVLLATAVQVTVVARLSRPLDERVYREQAEAARASALASDFTVGLRVLKGFGAEGTASERYRRASRSSMDAALRRVRVLAALTALNAAIPMVFLAAIALGAALLARAGTISVGNFVTVVGLAQLIVAPMVTIAFAGGQLATTRGSARRVSGLIRTPALIDGPVVPTVRPSQGDPTVDSLQIGGLTVAPGEVIGVRSASPEALLDELAYRVPLAPAWYRYNGVDATDLGPDGWRERVFAPPQESAVFTGTVTTGLAAVPDRRLMEVAALDDVMTHLSDGLDSEVGEGGSRLSGGQRQRLLLARALHQPQPVLVLLEPTSAVDTVTEERIAAGFRGTGKVLVLITSSPALLAACDRVVDLEPSADRVTR